MVTCKDYAQFVKNKLKTKIKGMEKSQFWRLFKSVTTRLLILT